MFSVSDRVTNDVLEEDLEDTTSLFVDETGDTLDTTTTSETTNSRLGNTCIGEIYEYKCSASRDVNASSRPITASRNPSHSPWMLSRRILR